MKKLFPAMSNKPSTGVIVAIFICWFMCFVFIPFEMPLLLVGAWDSVAIVTGLEGVYHVINGVLMAFLAKEHLRESYVSMRMNPKRFAGTVAIACTLMLFTAAVCGWLVEFFSGGKICAVNIFPISEFDVSITAGQLATDNPVFGTICLAVFSPIAISVLFYASGFAPLCNGQRKWRAYVMAAFLLLLLCGFDILWRDNAGTVMLKYLIRLPIHLLACWAYEKTDSVWAPIFSLGILNLLSSLVSVAILR